MTTTKTTQTPELEALKQEATDLGLKFHPNIGFDSLLKRVDDLKAKDLQPQVTPDAVQAPLITKEDVAAARAKKGQGRQLSAEEIKEMKRKEANELVRVVVTCMNPNKNAWEGEIFITGNSSIPTIKKYVPFNVEAGYHIPKMILNMIQSREYQGFITEKDSKGRDIRKGVQKKEFNVQILPPLAPEEFAALKQRQALAAGKTQ